MGTSENQDKSIFGYIVWTVFAVYCGLGMFSVLWAGGAAEIFGMSRYVLAGSVLICMYFMVTVFAMPRMISEERGKSSGGDASARRKRVKMRSLAVWLPVLVLLAVLAYLAFHLMTSPDASSFIRMSPDLAGQVVPFTVHGASWLYACLVHGVFLVSGGTPVALFALQVTLFSACILLLYVGMRAYTGAVPAAVSAAAFVFFPSSIRYVFFPVSGLFFLAFYLSGLCLMGILYRSFARMDAPASDSPKESRKAWLKFYLFALFVGLYAGFLVYLDLEGVSLFLFLAALFSADQKRGAHGKKKQACLASLIALAGGVCGFFYTAYVVVLSAGNLIGGGNFVENFCVFLERLAGFYAQRTDFWVSGSPEAFGVLETAPLSSLALFLLAFLNVPASFARRKSPVYAFLLNLVLTNILCFSGATGLDQMEFFGEQGQIMPILGWCMLAGVGIWGAVPMQEEAVAKIAAQDGDGDLDEMGAEIKEFNEIEAEDSGKKGTIQKKPAPGEPLHNPLPVPEKKKRARADFDYPVADSDMKFDVEVAENDDFDV